MVFTQTNCSLLKLQIRRSYRYEGGQGGGWSDRGRYRGQEGMEADEEDTSGFGYINISGNTFWKDEFIVDNKKNKNYYQPYPLNY